MTLPADIDEKLVDPGYFAGTAFHEDLTRLRHEDPVHWTNPASFGRGFWSLTRYEDCLTLLQDTDNFSNHLGTHLPPHGRDLTPDEERKMGVDVNIGFIDPPYHGEIRRPFNPHFSVPAVAKMHDDCGDIIDDIIDGVAASGTADVVRDIAAPLPARLFLSMMGVPEDDWDLVRAITLKMMHPDDPTWGVPDAVDMNAVTADAFGELQDYLSQHVLSRRGSTAKDMASIIANKDIRGRKLTDREASVMGMVIVGGGLETTRNAAAIGIMELIRRPEQAALLQDDTIAKTAVEEIIRWVTPSKNRIRLALNDVEIGGKQIKKGDWVVGWVVSANRDEEIFGPTADQFDITRDPNPHLGFGDGEHICLGRNVARLELRMLLPRLFDRLPDMRITEEPTWVHSTNTTGIADLPIAFEPRSSLIPA